MQWVALGYWKVGERVGVKNRELEIFDQFLPELLPLANIETFLKKNFWLDRNQIMYTRVDRISQNVGFFRGQLYRC